MTSFDELTAEQRQAFIERMRQTGLRLDREGRWWHEGQVVEHGGLLAALHRWLDRLEDGRYVLRLDERRYAYVDVEDAPYQVRTVIRDPGQPLRLLLSDGSEEVLDPETLSVGDDHALYCRVKQGRFEARFSRGAYYLLADQIEETDGGFAFGDGAHRVPLRRRPPEQGA